MQNRNTQRWSTRLLMRGCAILATLLSTANLAYSASSEVVLDAAIEATASTSSSSTPSEADTLLPPARIDDSDPSASANRIRVLLSSTTETTLVAQVAANITELDASLGATIKKGQTLVRFNCAEASARLRMSQAEHRAAQQTLGAKQRMQKLNAAGDMEVSLAKAELDRAGASIAVNQAQLAQCNVKAPFDGRVVKVHVKPHQGVNVGTPLLELVSDGPLKLRLNVPSKLLTQLKVGTPIEVDIYETGQAYQATVNAINGRVDAVAQTIELEAQLDEAYEDLLPGMSGVARLQLPREDN